MFHQEMVIPINKDKRNLEEKRKEMFSTLENKYGSQRSSVVSKQEKSICSRDDMWDMEVMDWINNSRTTWDRDIQRIRSNLFRLEPLDMDDFMHDVGGDHSTTSSKTVTQSVKKVTSTTCDGQTTTSESSYHKSSNDDIGMNKNTAVLTNTSLNDNRDLISSSSHDTLTNTDFLKDAFELAEDQKVHFKIRLETTEFSPEDIKVTTMGNKITIKAKKEIKQGNSMSYREFSRTITIPPSVDSTKFQCLQTKDGILILEAPLKQQDKLAISVKEGHLGVRAISDQKSTFSDSLVKVTGKSGPVIIDDAVFGKKIHLEITVDSDYEPSDFTVYTDLNKIHIKGRHVVKTANSSSSKEFSRYYEVPETLDPMSVSFHLISSTLVVEAPLLRTV